MKKAQKILSLVAVLMLLVGAFPAFAESAKDPVTFTMYVEDPMAHRIEENFQGTVSKKITADTGVTLKYQFGVGDVSQQVTLMVADRSFPDFVFSRSNLATFMAADAYIDMAPLIEEYGPNIKKLYGKSFDKNKDAQGRIFYLGQAPINDTRLHFDPEDSFELQLAVLKELNYPEIRTLDQFADAIRQYKAKYPEIDGQPTIGLTLTCGEGWRYYITLINPSIRATGGPDDGNFFVDPDTKKVIYAFANPKIKEYFRFLNGLYAEGLLDPDAFTQTHDEYLAKVSSGRVLALTDANWEFEEAETTLRSDGKEWRTYARFPVTLSKDIPHQAYRPDAYIVTNGVGITTNCKDPVRAVQFLDYLCREEIQVMTHWGFEGEDWHIVDGKRKPIRVTEDGTDSIENILRTGIGLTVYPFPDAGLMKDKDGYWISPNSDDDALVAAYTTAAKEVLAGYGVRTWRELFPRPETLKESTWGQAWRLWDALPKDEEFGMLHNECNALAAEYLAKAASAAPDQFEAVWNEFETRLKDAGVDRLGELATELLKTIDGKVAPVYE